MNFLEILRNEATNLPIGDYKGPFRELLRQKLTTFGYIIDNSDDLSKAIKDEGFNPDAFKLQSKIVRKGLLNVIDRYYEGNPSKAYKCLADFMKKAEITNYLNKKLMLGENSNFFRIRIHEGNYPLSKDELFHIPFHLRSKVHTQRYSIPGLPSLYLSNSIFVAWEELKRPAFNEIQATRLVNTRPLILLDLTTDIFVSNGYLIDNVSNGLQLLYSVMIWPVVAACSIKVLYPADPFKPEYIIPQLLLQWVNKAQIDGIKYSSTHIDLNHKQHKGSFYNVVLPVKSFNQDSGYCQGLQSLFRSTQVIPLQLRQSLLPADRFPDQETIHQNVNPDIEAVEIIKGHLQPYANTIFGALEHSLIGITDEDW